MDDLVYFVNSQGETVYLSSPGNRNYFELMGRTGFTAPELDIFSEKYANGKTRYFGKAIKPRTCRMNMVVRGKDQAERDKVFFDMIDILLDVAGGEEGRLYVKGSDGSLVYLNCVYSSGLKVTEQYKTLQKFALEFYAADPWFYRKKEIRIPVNSPSTVVEVINPTAEKQYLKAVCKKRDDMYGTISGSIFIQKRGNINIPVVVGVYMNRFVNGIDRVVIDAHTGTAWYETPGGRKELIPSTSMGSNTKPFDLDPGTNEIQLGIPENLRPYFNEYEFWLSVLYKQAGI